MTLEFPVMKAKIGIDDRLVVRNLLLAQMILILFASCRPFGEAGEPCSDSPCEIGLECVSGICMHPPVVPIVAPPCEADIECIQNGSMDGRACEEGQCVWTDCDSDSDCGTRICEDGQCTERTVCIDDTDCKDEQLCDEGACRNPCESDEECTEGALDTCVDGRCRQSCFIDLLCFGDICEDGICVPPECESDPDCGEENVACEGGRCISFLGCEEDDDCFDPDYFCSDIGRCEERPACQTDAECGPSSLCLGGICRDSVTCDGNGDCEPDEECVANKCVAAPDCRSNADCESGESCIGSNCTTIEYEDPESIVIETPFGACESDGTGACRLQIFVGERFTARTGGFDAEQAPVAAELAWDVASSDVATITEGGLITGIAPGLTQIVVSHVGGALVHQAFEIEVLSEISLNALRVLVVDAGNGAPIEGALVYAGLEGGTTDEHGLVLFDEEPASEPVVANAIGAYKSGRTGLMVLDLPLTGDIRLSLPVENNPTDAVAGFSASVVSTGDELGSTGLGVALPCLDDVKDATVERLFGEPAFGSIEVPLLGNIPVEVPVTMVYETSIPLVGNQVVRDQAYAVARAGRCIATAMESRSDDGGLGDLFGGASARDRALEVAAQAEGMDILLQSVGLLEALPLVEDGDTTDGIADFDGDGDLQEMVPDFGQMGFFEMSPSRVPTERVGIRVESNLLDTDGNVFVALGLQVPGTGFTTTGLGLISAAAGDDYQQVKVVPPQSWGASAIRRGVADLLLNDSAQSSRLFYTGTSFPAKQSMGAFLAPPEGAFALEDLPDTGNRLLVLPAVGTVSAYDFELQTEQGAWRVIAPSLNGGGRSVALPSVLTAGPFQLNRIAAISLAGEDSLQATLNHYQGGGTFAADIRTNANAVSELRNVVSGQ
jgi:hypothetical protein